MNKNILFFGISIFLLGFVTSSIQIAEATNISQFNFARILEQPGIGGCGIALPTTLSLTMAERIFLDPNCEYILEISADSAAAGFAEMILFEEEFFGVLDPHNIAPSGWFPSGPGETHVGEYIIKCDDDLNLLIKSTAIFGPFENTNEREAEFYVENGGGLRVPPHGPGLGQFWFLTCSNSPLQFFVLIMSGEVNEVFDDGFLNNAISVGDPWAASFEFSPGQTLFNDGTTSSFRVSNVEFGFGTGNDMIKYSNLPPSALFDDSITAFDDFGVSSFDEIQTQDFTLQQESGPPLPTEDVFFAADFFDADGDVIGSPINSFSDLLNVLEDPNFLSNLEANQILFEALDEFAVPVSNEIVTPLEFSPSQFGEGVAILGNIDTIIVTRSQQAVGGEIIPIDSTALILAGAQTNAIWIIPLIVAAAAIGIVVSRKSENYDPS